MFHHGWVKIEGRVLDKRIRTIYHDNTGGSHVGGGITLHNYVVEFTAPDGEMVRREVEQHVETVDVAVGAGVPLIVSPDGKKAELDRKDPRINVMDVYKAGKQADKERFEQRLKGD
jgi:hypothetical protein